MKILLIRLSSIGDIVLTTPVIRCLKRQRPTVTLHYLTKSHFANILQHNPYLTKIHAFEGKLRSTIAELKQEQFDLIVDLHHNQRTFLIKQALRVQAYSFNKLTIEKWLMVYWKWNRLPDIPIVDRYLATVASLGIQNDGKGLDYFIPKTAEVCISKHFPTLLPYQYVAVVIGAKHATKRLPNAKIQIICELIERPIILLGGKEDKENGSIIVEKLCKPIYNACGQFSLHQSASIIQQAYKVVTHDTGLMHIAAAFQKDICVIWGNTIPAFGMYPYLAQNSTGKIKMMEVKELNCRPCSKIGHKQCPKKHFNCMELIDENEIADWVNGKEL